jgi:Na+-transporting methylmalonyl-CoA/oxaloacetate decarboxylase gamma subunit
MLSFTALDMTAEERDQALRSADSDRLDGKLSRYEFMDLCTTTLWDQPLDQLKDASACYAEFRDKLKQRANMRWRAQADSIDRNCRFWVPLTYLVVFSVVVSMRLEDHYSGPVGSSASQQSTTYQEGTQQQVLASSSAGGGVVYRPMSELFGAVSLLGLHPGGYVMIVLFAVALVAWVLVQLTNRSIQREKARKSVEESSTVKDYTERAVRKQATSSSLLASATSTKVLPSMRLQNAAAEQA